MVKLLVAGASKVVWDEAAKATKEAGKQQHRLGSFQDEAPPPSSSWALIYGACAFVMAALIAAALLALYKYTRGTRRVQYTELSQIYNDEAAKARA